MVIEAKRKNVNIETWPFASLHHRKFVKRAIPAVAAAVIVALASTGVAAAQAPNLYWGDTHLHTSYSIDAYQWGNINVDPDTAYRFAQGLPVLHPTLRNRVRLRRPLDFLGISDHDVNFGRNAPVKAEDPAARLKEAWTLYVDAADRHYQPGKFTTFIGWEWTSTPGGNLHRVIFTPANAEAAKQFIPFSTRDSNRPEALWRWLEETSARLKIDFVSIPHNSNVSNGLMFDMVDSDGRSITAEYARTRMRWEPVVEVLQIKGNSETHPALSPNDEFANFEIYMALLTGGITTPQSGAYVRTGLLRGLEIESRTGVNPYKFGFQGGTDSHTGLASSEEDNFFGKSTIDTIPEKKGGKMFQVWDSIGYDFSAQGVTGVWATANTREAIAAAFKRKEVYATSGSRISLRVFGGFRFRRQDAQARDIAEVGYRLGVPMGGDLTAAPRGRAVTLLIHAVKDPIGANLDRIQVVKGWLDASGRTHEKVYDVAWSGARSIGPNGKLPPLNSTVDVRRATFDNSTGAAQLSTVWVDPDFNPQERAFYYVRVLEIATPRHSLYDAVALGIDPSQTTRPAEIQERAFSSPIWYTP